MKYPFKFSNEGLLCIHPGCDMVAMFRVYPDNDVEHDDYNWFGAAACAKHLVEVCDEEAISDVRA